MIHREYQQFGIGVYQCCACLKWLHSYLEVQEHIVQTADEPYAVKRLEPTPR